MEVLKTDDTSTSINYALVQQIYTI